MQSWETREWFTAFLDALNRHRRDGIAEFLEPSVRRAHLPAGADAWLDDLDELFRAFPDWRWRRIQLVVEDDRLAAHLRGSGTHSASFRGIAATHRRVNVAEFGIYRLAGGRVAEHSGTDYAELLLQLGA